MTRGPSQSYSFCLHHQSPLSNTHLRAEGGPTLLQSRFQTCFRIQFVCLFVYWALPGRPCLQCQGGKMSAWITHKLFSPHGETVVLIKLLSSHGWIMRAVRVSPQQISQPRSTLFQLVCGWGFPWRRRRLRQVARTQMASSKDVFRRYGVACQHLMNRPPPPPPL